MACHEWVGSAVTPPHRLCQLTVIQDTPVSPESAVMGKGVPGASVTAHLASTSAFTDARRARRRTYRELIPTDETSRDETSRHGSIWWTALPRLDSEPHRLD